MPGAMKAFKTLGIDKDLLKIMSQKEVEALAAQAGKSGFPRILEEGLKRAKSAIKRDEMIASLKQQGFWT